MLSVAEAESIVFNLVRPFDGDGDVETLELLSAFGRILAAPVKGSLDFPHWDNSAMDGYAVRYEDVKDCSAEKPKVLEIVEEIPAGKPPQVAIAGGETARILTGSMMPAGADTVVIQEETKREGNKVEILAAPPLKGNFVRRQGEFYRAGDELLPAGIALGAPDIAVLASAQCVRVPVYRRPRVAIFSTGDELTVPGEPLQPGHLIDSNSYALAALAAAAGGEPLMMGIVPDDPKVLKDAIARAILSADIVISTGGVSVGDYDYVERILSELGGAIHIKSVAVKPGKPLTVATFTAAGDTTEYQRKILYFGLPGNPVSALVSFWRFVQPALRKMAGFAAGWQPVFLSAQTRQDLRSGGRRETYLWGQIQLVDGGYEFDLAGGSHSSGNLINLAQTSGLAVLPVGEKFIPAGEVVRVMQVGLAIGS
ncbi:MAG: molybdopterin molybdotransferase MoeA [Oscillatoria sp. SIO1A7]|nr:molybdopterin molybdotransferase MoeA [Oscillatoria sp. SIO1A7]